MRHSIVVLWAELPPGKEFPMNNRGIRRLLPVVLGLAGLLVAVPAIHAAGGEAVTRDRQQEVKASEIETLFQDLLDSNDTPPVFTEYGDGFYSLSAALRPEVRDRLLAAARSGELTGLTDKAQTFFVLSTGQQLTSPSDPGICIHASLSLATAPYNYWVVVLNLGTRNVTSKTTLKLSGPGLKFNRSFQVTYGANGIWVVWYNPGVGVGQSGLYTLQSTAAGGGSASTKSFAVFP